MNQSLKLHTVQIAMGLFAIATLTEIVCNVLVFKVHLWEMLHPRTNQYAFDLRLLSAGVLFFVLASFRTLDIFILIKIYQRKNEARWLFTALILLAAILNIGLLCTSSGLLYSFPRIELLKVVSGIFLWLPSSEAWFVPLKVEEGSHA